MHIAGHDPHPARRRFGQGNSPSMPIVHLTRVCCVLTRYGVHTNSGRKTTSLVGAIHGHCFRSKISPSPMATTGLSGCHVLSR